MTTTSRYEAVGDLESPAPQVYVTESTPGSWIAIVLYFPYQGSRDPGVSDPAAVHDIQADSKCQALTAAICWLKRRFLTEVCLRPVA